MRSICLAACAVVFVWVGPASAQAQPRPTALAVSRGSAELRAVDQQVDQLLRSRDLRVRETMRDTMLPDRQHERLDQYHRGVRIVGGDLTRQLAPDGTMSVFGMFHQGLELSTAARLSVGDARSAIGRAVNGALTGLDPELVVLPLPDGYHLAYYGRAFDGVEIFNVFVSADDGSVLQQYSEFQTEVGKGKGTYGDDKKVSAKSGSGTFLADDPLRPGAITTYDMKGDFTRATNVLNGAPVSLADIASDTDNNWTDGTVVDAHVYSGWYYDYLFKRFNRRGIDDRDLRMAIITHPVRLADIASQPANVLGLYYRNAFFCSTCGPDGRGTVLFGEGGPNGFFGNYEVKPFSAALDVVAHELTHAVVAATARLNGFPFSEAGGMNEGFADIFGIATAFFHFPPGSGPLNANYNQGGALTVPQNVLGRPVADPQQRGYPDHYSRRIIGGEVHAMSTLISHPYYLAIEGGVNRTSGMAVQGVGQANREQIEKAFFRALTVLMPSGSTLALARAATIQAARDLYGTGSPADRAITQAWDATGVQERTVPTAALNPATANATACGATPTPNWITYLTASAGSSNLRVTQWTLNRYDAAGAPIPNLTSTFSGAQFATSFTQCGPGSDRIVANADACVAFCISLGGRTSGSMEYSFTAIDDAGRTLTATSPRVTLR